MIQNLNKVPKYLWVCFTITAVIGIIVFGRTVAKSGHFSFENGETKIKIGQVKEAINNDAFAASRLETKIKILEETIDTLKQNQTTEAEASVIEAFEDLKPTAEAAIKNSEELHEKVNVTIENQSE